MATTGASQYNGSMQHFLGIDYGSTRIGIAKGDIDSKVAHAVTTLANDETFFPALLELAETYSIKQIIVGLPRNLEGDDTAQTVIARDFASELEGRGFSVTLQDEALTSEVARENLGPKAAKVDIDAEAARLILQDYLNSL
jgi:putative Holliday junction resolvase